MADLPKCGPAHPQDDGRWRVERKSPRDNFGSGGFVGVSSALALEVEGFAGLIGWDGMGQPAELTGTGTTNKEKMSMVRKSAVVSGWCGGAMVFGTAAAVIASVAVFAGFAQAEAPVAARVAPVVEPIVEDEPYFGDDESLDLSRGNAPVVRTACCIWSEDRCVNPMTISECNAVGGTLLRHCRFCQIRITGEDGFDDESTEEATPVVAPTTLVRVVASFMMP